MSNVGVWMPVYNEQRHLRAALQSVLEQRFTNFTLYVSNNYSTDESAAILEEYAARWPEHQFVCLSPPNHLAGIEHMKFMWDLLRDERAHQYSIHIGAHDLWPPDHLQVLVESMDRRIASSAAGQTVAITYSDTWFIDDEGVALYPLTDVMQVDQMRREIIPLFVLAGIRAPHLFGMWNEAVRRKIPVRHCCSGWDHFVVAEAALHGAIAFENSTTLRMRASSYDRGLADYGRKHLAEEILASGALDFRNQLEWCLHLVDNAVQSLPEANRTTTRSLLTTSMVSMYLSLRSYNMQAVPRAAERFFADVRAQQIILASRHIDQQVRQFVDCFK